MNHDSAPNDSGGPWPSWQRKLMLLLASALGFGYAPFAPGTFGTIPAVAIHILILLCAAPQHQPWLIGTVLAAVCIVSVPLGNRAERLWGKKDPGRFVLDEVAGYLLTVLLFATGPSWKAILWAFALTRIFDIIKIPPARQMEKLPGGWGILLDDLVSALYSAGALYLMRHFLPNWF